MRKVERSATKESNQKSPFDNNVEAWKFWHILRVRFHWKLTLTASFQKRKSVVVFSFMNWFFYSLRHELKSTCLIKAAVLLKLTITWRGWLNLQLMFKQWKCWNVPGLMTNCPWRYRINSPTCWTLLKLWCSECTAVVAQRVFSLHPCITSVLLWLTNAG